MTLQTNNVEKSKQRTHDVRLRTDEYNREYIAAEGRYAVDAAQERDIVPGSEESNLTSNDKLVNLLEASVQSLRHASENIENRGLKLVLKVMAEARARMLSTLRHELGDATINPLDPSMKSSSTVLQEGLQDFQASMTVQQDGRENVVLNHLAGEEEKLLAAYDEAWQENSAPMRLILEEQRAQVAQFVARLRSTNEGFDPLVARVFDTRIEGEQAVARLHEHGFDPSQIDVAPINVVARPVVETVVATASPRSAIVAGAFGGAVIGGIIGLILALFIWLAPQSVAWISVGPFTLFLLAMVVFAIFGSVFGFFIGANKRENDLAVTADGLINGEILVAVYAHPNQIAVAEEVLQVHHGRELNR